MYTRAAAWAARSGEQRTTDPSPYLFLSHGIDVLTVRAQDQVSQDGAAFVGHNILILQSLVLPLSWQIHKDLWGEQGGVSMIPHTPQPHPWDTECAPPSHSNVVTPQPLQHSCSIRCSASIPILSRRPNCNASCALLHLSGAFAPHPY